MKRNWFIVALVMVVMLSSLLSSMSMTTQARQTTQTASPVKLFDASKGEFPEGLAFDNVGNFYVSVSSLGQIWGIMSDGSEKLLLTVPPVGGSMAFGLAVDASGDVYATFAFNPETRGVYRIDHGSGVAQRIPGTENILWANGLTFDNRGNLYVTDSWTGAIWRIPPHGSASIWLQHDSLEGLGQIPGFPPVGANGVAYYHGSLLVANTEKGLLVLVPIEETGASGVPRVVAEGSELYGLDGIALDVHGNVYAALVLQNKLVKIDHKNAEITVLATADDGLDMPASPAFSTGKCHRQTLFFTNFALLGTNPTGLGPAVLKIGVATPGLPLP